MSVTACLPFRQEDGDARAVSRPQQDQTAYIMSLEQQNLHLKEANLNLQEVLCCFAHCTATSPLLCVVSLGRSVLGKPTRFQGGSTDSVCLVCAEVLHLGAAAEGR